ncbi:hypothetical protein FGW37_04350 [Streptomyces rectiverticillatus]|uniref:hypothetical protein n=1 Tax=Streptomyces rectiverticillatus TaxID=173860 RepID=UPI0015C32EEB|nr:hypothetical protein [Streptomyces rectiverticillatus]QLE70937.1 hypothetical protein FGW37_04350 [Streptomyces rectiverticillatus]
MEAELAALAASGATTLVGLMVSETWSQARERVARFLARGADEGAVDEELRLSEQELVAARAVADEPAVADIEAGWRLRLRRALQADPGAAEELRLLLAELAPGAAGSDAAITVHNSVSGGVQNGPVIQGQQFSGLTFYSSGSAPRGQGAGQPNE